LCTHTQISTNAKIIESAAFIKRVREEYFDPKAKKLKEELQAAFAELLVLILTLIGLICFSLSPSV
jgi:hypothetical protein